MKFCNLIAEIKRQEQAEAFKADSKKAQLTPTREPFQQHSHKSDKRRYREVGDETPSYGGGVNRDAKSAIESRSNKSRRVDYTTSQEKDRSRDRRDRDRSDRDRDRDRGNRDKYDDRDRDRKDRERYERDGRRDRDSDRRRDRDRRDDYRDRDRRSERSSYRSSSRREDGSVRFKDEPLTPAFSVANTPRAWDDDENFGEKRSQWDYPTPNPYADDVKIKREVETPLPTPAHKYNPWVKQPGSSRFITTPGYVKSEKESVKDEEELLVDRDEWEDEQKRLDREWYSMDEGYDEVHNPFAGVSEDYTKKKEEQLQERKHQRMSAQQRQIHRDNELWEKNRLLTSGVVINVDHSEDYDEDNEARVHLLVHNIVPPFLDGRIVFTKQFEPVVPVRVSDSLSIVLYF